MPVILATAIAALGRMAISALASLVTESVLRSGIIILLEKLAKKTDTDVDDRLLASIKGENNDSKPDSDKPSSNQ